jgi:hypothetical protein
MEVFVARRFGYFLCTKTVEFDLHGRLAVILQTFKQFVPCWFANERYCSTCIEQKNSLDRSFSKTMGRNGLWFSTFP